MKYKKGIAGKHVYCKSLRKMVHATDENKQVFINAGQLEVFENAVPKTRKLKPTRSKREPESEQPSE